MSGQTAKAGSAGKAIITFSRGWQTLVAVRSLGRRRAGGRLIKLRPDMAGDPNVDYEAVEALLEENGFSASNGIRN